MNFIEDELMLVAIVNGSDDDRSSYFTVNVTIVSDNTSFFKRHNAGWGYKERREYNIQVDMSSTNHR